jgi:CheY-like chemotaxis protein
MRGAFAGRPEIAQASAPQEELVSWAPFSWSEREERHMSERPRVLIADDETVIRLDLRDLLERAGLDVCGEARDGVEAVELARSEQPDLAILDVKMPRLDGVGAARVILAERRIPIVMLTAYGYGDLVARAVDAGVAAYVVKPFRESDLLLAVERSLDRSTDRAPDDDSRVDLELRSAGGAISWPLTLLRRGDGGVDVRLRDDAS